MSHDFSRRYEGRRPAALSGDLPYMAPKGRDLVRGFLDAGCGCATIDDLTATLRRRSVNGAVAIWLQCDGCGHSLGAAMRREFHPRYHDYPLWDEALARRYDEGRAAYVAGIPTLDEQRQRREEEYRVRRIEYELWCRSSPEWAALVKLVAWRSRGHCEACLSASADVVHHLTYDFGKMPPAWHLKAVCRTCHGRLHTQGDDWCDFGMARHQ